VLTVLKSGSLNLLEPSGTVQACNGIALLCNTSWYLLLKHKDWYYSYINFWVQEWLADKVTFDP